MACLSCIVYVVLGLLVLLKIYNKLKTGWCKSKVCLVGKTVIVTGANTGIGYEAALDFAMRGARVILACRDKARANQARDKIIKETQNQNVVVKLIDLASFKSVRHFAKDILETEERLDVLVNNAGLITMQPKPTEDGLDTLMQVNYFGPFLLTVLLTGLLKKSAPSRIVNVSSLGAAYGKLDFDKIGGYAGSIKTERNSKLADILFTIHLARLLEKHNVTVYSLNPGAVITEIIREFRGILKMTVGFLRPIIYKTAEEGAQTTIHTAISQGVEIYTGKHFEDCHVVKHYKSARDPELAKKLWDKSVEIVNCEEEIEESVNAYLNKDSI